MHDSFVYDYLNIYLDSEIFKTSGLESWTQAIFPKTFLMFYLEWDCCVFLAKTEPQLLNLFITPGGKNDKASEIILCSRIVWNICPYHFSLSSMKIIGSSTDNAWSNDWQGFSMMRVHFFFMESIHNDPHYDLNEHGLRNHIHTPPQTKGSVTLGSLTSVFQDLVWNVELCFDKSLSQVPKTTHPPWLWWTAKVTLENLVNSMCAYDQVIVVLVLASNSAGL